MSHRVFVDRATDIAAGGALDSCDIFCAVIDNYGDIGVSWRLARQLAREYRLQVRLWVDDPAALQRIWPALNAQLDAQFCAGVDVRRWRTPFADTEAAALVIEAFGCQLPDDYIVAMTRRQRPPLWINLEYLSAESWVDDCHGLPSPYSPPPALAGALQRPLHKFFFFPGFSERSGGLLCERDLLERRQSFQRDPQQRAHFLARWGVPAIDAFAVSLFAYENSALPSLLTAWEQSPQAILCLVPEGRSLAALASFFGEPGLPVGAVRRRGALTAVVLPFLTQDDYDRLLWSCDLNLVRGEDSFVRAQWAARPLFWHIYPQRQQAHWPKLNAFLERYCQALPAPAATALRDCWWAWNGIGDSAAAWRRLSPHLQVLSAHGKDWSAQLARGGNLAAALVQFCANHV